MDSERDPHGTWEEDIVLIEHEDTLENPGTILPQSDETISKIRAWLKPTDYDGEGSEYKKHRFSHLTGTGTWFRASEGYSEWHDGEQIGMLWAQGTVLFFPHALPTLERTHCLIPVPLLL